MTESKRIFVDTAPLIYFLEKNDLYFSKLNDFFEQAIQNEVEFVTSTISIEEYCVYPFRTKNIKQIERFESFLNDLEFEIIDINKEIALKAAEIRANFKDFKSMDSLQLASAIARQCDSFLTNDKQLKQFNEIKISIIE